MMLVNEELIPPWILLRVPLGLDMPSVRGDSAPGAESPLLTQFMLSQK
jgi:hypothetical protein